MRDFARNNNKSSINNHGNANDKTSSSYAVRKTILALLLLILIIAFVLSFYSKNQLKLVADATPNSTTVSTLAKVLPKEATHVSTVQPSSSNEAVTQKQATDDTAATDSKSVKKTLSPQKSSNKLSTTDKTTTTNKENIDHKDTKSSAAKEQKDQPLTFTFYDTLTHKTVQVDTNPEKLTQYRYTYMLQVGSYRNQSDANATRAKLILAGLKPTMKKIGDWYRLDVGPVYTQRDGDVLKHTVEAAGISGSVLRQVDKQAIPTQANDENP